MTPSPYYLLLTNPGWAAHETDLAEVVAGAGGKWPLDPNENGGQGSLLGAMLARWYRLKHPEEALLSVVGALVDRGADPGRALAETNENRAFDWHYYAGVQSFLQGRHAGLDPGQCMVGARMICEMGKVQGTTETRKNIEQHLAGLGGWNTTLNGVPAASWLALHSCHEGRLGGWSGSMFDSTSDYYTKQLRQMRALATAAKSRIQDDPTALFSMACGMLLACTYTPKSMAGTDAATALSAQANGLLAPIGEPGLADLFRKTLDKVACDPHHRFRLSMAVIKGLAPQVGDPHIAWDLIGMALPYLHENQVYLGGKRSLDAVLDPKMGLPPRSFFDNLPVNDQTHHALLCIFTGQYRISETPTLRPFRQTTPRMLDDMLDWASRGQLHPVDLEGYLADNYYLKGNAPTLEKMNRYLDHLHVQQQANALDRHTQSTHAPRPTWRI